MTWNYRVCKAGAAERSELSMREVYYNDQGQITGVSEGPVAFWCWEDEGIKGLQWTLKRMFIALKEPILDLETLTVEFETRKEQQHDDGHP